MQNFSYDLISNCGKVGVQHLRSTTGISMYEGHCHPHYEIYIQLSGCRSYFIKDRVFIIKEGDIVLVKPYVMHRTSSHENKGFERLLIDFGDEYMNSLRDFCSEANEEDFLPDDFYVLSSDVLSNSYLKDISLRLIQEKKRSEKSSDSIIRLIVGQIMMLISRLNHADSVVNAAESKSYKRISDIIEYIEKNYNQKISLEDISQKYFISYHYLSHTFRDITGLSFTEYVNTVRVSKAREMIENKTHPLNSISELVGFGSYKQFGRIFKEITGVSPSQYFK